MPLLTNQDKDSRATGTALTYITIGAVLMVIAGTSFYFFNEPFSDNRILGYIRVTTLLIGLVLLGIGLGLGQIARTTRAATTDVDKQAAMKTIRDQAQAHAEQTKL